MAEQSVVKTVTKLAVTAVAMFAFVFVVMVPLYDTLCQVLGINGKTQGKVDYETVQAGVDESRTVKVQFVASNAEGMVWAFRPTQTQLKVHPGAVNTTQFFAQNPTAEHMVAQAVPSIVPARAAAYFHKTECFCFNQQPLDGGKTAEMPLQFIVDRDLPADIHTITLSYTIFDVTEMAGGQGDVAAR